MSLRKSLEQILVGSRNGRACNLYQHADLASGMDIGTDAAVTFHIELYETADLDVFADDRN